MAAKIRLILLFIIVAFALSVAYCEEMQLDHKATEVRATVEASTLATTIWRMREDKHFLSSHIALAIGTSDNDIAMLCLEGSMNRILPLHPDDSRLSELQLTKETLGFVHSTAVFFYQCKDNESIFLDATSFSMKDYHDIFFIRNNLRAAVTSDCPIIQININGATCQPGNTVLSQIFAEDTNAIQDGDTIKILKAQDGSVVNQYALPKDANSLLLINYIKDTFVLAAERKLQISVKPAIEQLAIGDKVNDTKSSDGKVPAEVLPPAKVLIDQSPTTLDPFTAKSPFDPGCPYHTIALYDMKSKTLKPIKPLLDNALMGFSPIVRVSNHWVWWEYYPSGNCKIIAIFCV